jgi:predicted PhzF superfamily epimerase YddE/YHI9
MAEGFPPLTYLFCAETRHSGNDLSARFFFEAHGVREDPATGNGAAFLASYLRMHGVYPPEKRTWRIEQGHEVRRPSLVQIRFGDRDGFKNPGRRRRCGRDSGESDPGLKRSTQIPVQCRSGNRDPVACRRIRLV